MGLLTNRLGERKLMNCGEYATIIEYRGTKDIDIMFEDGTIREKVRYTNFCLGCILKNGNFKNRIGERRRMNCGVYATIIRYRNADNITVKFDDSDEEMETTYQHFRNGTLARTRSNDYQSKYVGMIKELNSGEVVEVVSYVNSKNIDVKFQDGTIREGVSLESVLTGWLSKVPADLILEDLHKSRIGERKKQHCGEYCTVVDYVCGNNITVKFDDGTQRSNVRYSEFKHGTIGKNGKGCNLTVAYIVGGISYYLYESNGRRYLGTIAELEERVGKNLGLSALEAGQA